MLSQRHLPDVSRVSVLIATVLLAYAITRVIRAPNIPVELSLAGFFISLNINLSTALAIFAAGLIATGMDWLLRDHPLLKEGQTASHWLLPTLTALVIGVSLSTLPSGLIWWLGFALGGIILIAVVIAEYIVVDPTDARYPLATAVLIALSFTLYLVLAAALRFAGVRLFLLIPAMFLAAGLSALRTIHLRSTARWEYRWALGIALVGVQLAAALHYWPMAPVQFGLVLLGPVYALTSLAVGMLEEVPFRRAVVEPAVMLGLIWGLAVLFR